MSGSVQNAQFTFNASADTLHEYIAFDSQNNLLAPEFIKENNGQVANQNLHGLKDLDFCNYSAIPIFWARRSNLPTFIPKTMAYCR